MGTQSSSSPLQPPPISVQVSDKTEQSADAQSCLSGASPASPASSHPGTCLSVTKLRAVSSVRPYTSSSTLSTRTRDGSQGFDDSTGEVMSDDSLSEPDAWLEFDGISAATNNWKRTFQRAVDRGMGRLWARYNHDWDAQIRQRPGGRSNDASKFQDWSKGTPKGTSSRQTLGKGLRPSGRSFADDDEEDDDDEGYRPGSSLSKRSTGSAKRFACPFRKHDPQTYNIHDHEVCAIRSWSTISRLK